MTIIQIPEVARTQALLICSEIPYLSSQEETILRELDVVYGLGGWKINFNHPIQGQVCAITQYERSGILLLALFKSAIVKAFESRLRQRTYQIAKETNKQLLAQEFARV